MSVTTEPTTVTGAVAVVMVEVALAYSQHDKRRRLEAAEAFAQTMRIRLSVPLAYVHSLFCKVRQSSLLRSMLTW